MGPFMQRHNLVPICVIYPTTTTAEKTTGNITTVVVEISHRRELLLKRGVPNRSPQGATINE